MLDPDDDWRSMSRDDLAEARVELDEWLTVEARAGRRDGDGYRRIHQFAAEITGRIAELYDPVRDGDPLAWERIDLDQPGLPLG